MWFHTTWEEGWHEEEMCMTLLMSLVMTIYNEEDQMIRMIQ